MRSINVEIMMGHDTGLSESYYKPTQQEVLQDYLKAAPLLTIKDVRPVGNILIDVNVWDLPPQGIARIRPEFLEHFFVNIRYTNVANKC